jgi:hypothetical protein
LRTHFSTCAFCFVTPRGQRRSTNIQVPSVRLGGS